MRGGVPVLVQPGSRLVKQRLDEREAGLDEREAGMDVSVPWSYQALCSELEKTRRAELAPWQGEVVCQC